MLAVSDGKRWVRMHAGLSPGVPNGDKKGLKHGC